MVGKPRNRTRGDACIPAQNCLNAAAPCGPRPSHSHHIQCCRYVHQTPWHSTQHGPGHSSNSPLCRHPAEAAGPHCTLVRLQAQPSRQSARSQAGVGGHVHIPWHLHTGARAPPQTALHISIHLCGGQPASGGRGSTSVPQQRCFRQDTPAGWHCPCGHPSPADSTPGQHHRPLPGA